MSQFLDVKYALFFPVTRRPVVRRPWEIAGANVSIVWAKTSGVSGLLESGIERLYPASRKISVGVYPPTAILLVAGKHLFVDGVQVG